MHHELTATLASSREREIRTAARRPERLMTHLAELQREAS